MTSSGKVALVGAGPGDEGLLTVRGMELIKQADCIVYDRLLNKRFLELTKDTCEKIYVGKENHHHTMKQDDINELLFEMAQEHELVVRLKGGDPYVFGRGGEEALFLNARGIGVEVVPGVSSAVAAAALSGIPITHRGLSKGFMVITAHDRKDSISEINYSLLTDEDITLVFLMGLSHVKEIAENLKNVGRRPDTPAAVISCGTTTKQKKCIGTLQNIAELVEKEELISPAIIVVGEVVSLSEELSFFEKRSLFGKKFFLPEIKKFEYSPDGMRNIRANELEKKLTEKGAEVITHVAGRITPVDIDPGFLKEVDEEDYIVFTSVSGVNTFFYSLFETCGKDVRALPDCNFAAIGEKTAEALLRFGIKADVVSTKANSKDFAMQISRLVKEGTKIYWLCGKKHSEDFETQIAPGIELKKIVCYENVPSGTKLTDEEKKVVADCDGSIFTCGSNAIFAASQLEKIPGKIYSIGPACSKCLERNGVTDVIEAEESSYDGLLEIIERMHFE